MLGRANQIQFQDNQIASRTSDKIKGQEMNLKKEAHKIINLKRLQSDSMMFLIGKEIVNPLSAD